MRLLKFLDHHRFYIFLIFSAGLHLYLLYPIIKDSQNFLKINRSPSRILVDLTTPQVDPHDQKTKVISRFDYRGRGKFSPKEGQHLPGEFNPIAENQSTDLKKSQKSSTQVSFEDKKLNQKGKTKLEKEKNGLMPSKSEGENNNLAKTIEKSEKTKTSQKRLSVDTEDSLENKFWFDESEFFQISVRSHYDSEFNLELANLLKKRLITYVYAGGAMNFYYVKKDEVIALANVDQEGKVNFEKMIKSSVNQPYFNYLIRQVVSNPGIIKNLPNELLKNAGKRNDKLNFFFSISFTGEPLRKWWFGFDFFKPTDLPSESIE